MRHCEGGSATEAISLRNRGIASQSLAMTRKPNKKASRFIGRLFCFSCHGCPSGFWLPEQLFQLPLIIFVLIKTAVKCTVKSKQSIALLKMLFKFKR